MPKNTLKEKIYTYWDQASCGTQCTDKEKFSPAYFAEIESYRYRIEPEIFSFAQFSRFYGKKVLEVGVGAGTDFTQWVRSGAQAYGIDLTQEALMNASLKLSQEGLNACGLQVADAESLPYPDNFFDCVYSWGVIHHAEDTEQCLQEIIRVCKPGGIVKIMIYNRYSLFAFYRYLLCGLLKAKPFRSLSDVLFFDQESLGTKAYSFGEIRRLLKQHDVTIVSLKAPATQHDLLFYKHAFIRFFAYLLACLLGWNRIGWFMMIELQKNKPV